MYAGVGTIEEAEAKAALNEKQAKKGATGFNQMNLLPELHHATTRMGFNNPTPVQRKAIPPMIVGNDVVAMARTGSGKTVAYLIPTLQRLRGHSKVVGVRGLVLVPTRELALQVLRVAKRLVSYAATCPAARLAASIAQDPSNTLHRQGDAADTRNVGTLRCCAIVGGTSLEAQFAELTTNPDILVATPGRVLHIMEETSLKMLSNIEVVVMDEADRLFEMGLQPQIVQILGKVHESCQRALFSATMPSILAEFTSAGLHNPITIRLDAEMKISDKLKHSSFLVRSEEKIAALIFLLKKVVGVKTDVNAFLKGRDDHEKRKERKAKRQALNKKRGRNEDSGDDNDDDDDGDSEEEEANEAATGKLRRDCGPQCLVFVESKHHVDLFEKILEAYLISCSCVHGQMDQEARKTAVMRFAKRKVSVMVVTDVAARGLDIPLLDNVINFSFPFNPKLFVHRVGRVARAGRTGASYSIMTTEDMPYYIDLMRFLDHPIQHTLSDKVQMDDEGLRDDGTDGYYGRIPDSALRIENDYLMKLKKNNIEVSAALKVADHSHDKYTKTKKKASGDAVREMKRARKEALDKAAAAKMLAEGRQDDSDFDNDDDEYARPPPADNSVMTYDFYGTPIHPMLLAKLGADVVASDAAKLALRNFKSKEGGLIEVQHASDNKGEKLFTMQMPVLGQNIIAAEKATPAAPVKLSLAESMLLKAQQRKAGVLDSSLNTIAGKKRAQAAAADANANADDPMMEGITIEYNAFATNSSGNAANNTKARNILNQTAFSKYRDAGFFMDDERKEMHDDQHYTVKDATVDMAPESAEDAKNMRNVYAWNKKKSRYVKVAVNDAKAMLKGIKNEAGKFINFKKDKLDAYLKWTKKSNMRIQDCGEEEDDGAVVRARAAVESGSYAPAEEAEDDTSKNTVDGATNMRQLFGKKQSKKQVDAFGYKRKEGTVTESKWAARKQTRKSNRDKAKTDKFLSADPDYVDISDPNGGRKVRIAKRKANKLTKDGIARGFDDMVMQKKKRQEQREREGKGRGGGGKGGAKGGPKGGGKKR